MFALSGAGRPAQPRLCKSVLGVLSHVNWEQGRADCEVGDGQCRPGSGRPVAMTYDLYPAVAVAVDVVYVEVPKAGVGWDSCPGLPAHTLGLLCVRTGPRARKSPDRAQAARLSPNKSKTQPQRQPGSGGQLRAMASGSALHGWWAGSRRHFLELTLASACMTVFAIHTAITGLGPCAGPTRPSKGYFSARLFPPQVLVESHFYTGPPGCANQLYTDGRRMCKKSGSAKVEEENGCQRGGAGVLLKLGSGVSPSGTVWAAGSWGMRLAARGPCAASESMADHRAMENWAAAGRRAGMTDRLRALARRRKNSAASWLQWPPTSIASTTNRHLFSTSSG